MRTPFISCLLAAAGAVCAFQNDNQGIIAGQVVSQATGAPVKDAIVTLRFVKSDGPGDVMSQQTNETGQFSFTKLWGTDWELSAEGIGFARGQYRGTRYDPQGHFSLGRNQQIKDIVLKLIPQAVITGHVLDADGKPAEGAHVFLLKPGYAAGRLNWTESAVVTTLDNGEYRIPRVAPGRYGVKSTLPPANLPRMRSESEVETGYSPTYYPHTTDPALATMIDVSGGGEIAGVDIQLAPTRLFHIRGKLQPPVPATQDGQLLLVDRANPVKEIAVVRSEAPDFGFDVSRIAPGSYLVYANLYLSSAAQMVTALQPLDISDRDIDGLILRLARPDGISGVVRPKSQDRPVDLSKVSVRMLFTAAGRDLSAITWSPMTLAKDLTFRLSANYYPDIARFKVQVSDLPEGCYVASILYGPAEVPETGIEYSPPATLAITIGVDGGRVDGATLGEDGRPVGNAVAALFPADGKGAPKSLQADTQGAFHFSAIPPGDYKLIAWPDISRVDLENPDYIKQFDDKATPVSVTPGGSAAASVKVIAK